MGLDQYAYRRAAKLDKPVDFQREESDKEIFYWRKHPNLQGWMHALYKSKGGEDEDLQPVACRAHA